MYYISPFFEHHSFQWVNNDRNSDSMNVWKAEMYLRRGSKNEWNSIENPLQYNLINLII
jgi:hypothetical protein